MPGSGPPAGRMAICLCGPTATGKTELALELAVRLPVAVVSVDSALVYRGMDIGTGKPDAEVRARIPHALIDIRDPWEHYSAGEFCIDARAAIESAFAAGRVPLLVGGTMLYFRSLLEGLADLPAADAGIRAAIDAEADSLGWPAMHRQLARVDPASAARIPPGDRQRIQRALEVYRLSGRPLSELRSRRQPMPGVGFTRIALVPADRQVLYRRIEQRFGAMLAAGFLAEVDRLRGLPGMSPACPSMRSVGYRQLWAYLAGETTLDEARRRAVMATRHLAKRQLTWLRSDPPDVALDSGAADLRSVLQAEVLRALEPGAKRSASD